MYHFLATGECLSLLFVPFYINFLTFILIVNTVFPTRYEWEEKINEDPEVLMVSVHLEL